MKFRRKLIFIALFVINGLHAQTDIDGLMMAKNNLCGGIVYGSTNWNHYWEGTYYRNNQNIGTLQSKSVLGMLNYGISNKVNIIASLPYIKTNATSGTLRGQKGFQDVSLTAKYEFYGKSYKWAYLSFLAFGSVSAPSSTYVADYLPLAIGMHSKTASSRLMMDLQKKNWFFTASTQYTTRGNITIDRNAYYTTELIYSNQVAMPSVLNSNVRFGYRENADLIVELIYDRINTLGGFDIRKNDMPFLSNNMEASRVGFNWKLPINILRNTGLSWLGNATTTFAGRNMGQSHMLMTGLVYQGDFTKKQKQSAL